MNFTAQLEKMNLEIHEAKILNGIAHVDYTVDYTDIHQKIYVKTLVDWIVENKMNLVYITEPDELTALDPETCLIENLDYMVLEYLTEKLA